MVDAINSRDLPALDDLVAPDVVRKNAAMPGVEVDSPDDFKAFLETDFLTVPDPVMKIDPILGDDEFAGIRAIYSGMQTGQTGPFPPSGRHLELPFIGIHKLKNGKISQM